MNKRHFVQALFLPWLAAATPWLHAQTDVGISAPLVIKNYSALVFANYEDILTVAQDLQKTIQSFVAQPSANGLDAARKTWITARESYGQSEAFRFYGGPIDDAKGPEGRLNAWPMDEAYVDYVKGKPNAGLINNRKMAITKASLARNNARGGDENISTGWHAIEFLLWGQDLSADGPGNRSFEDYVDNKLPNADRRRQYLTVVTELLVDDLRYLVTAWTPGKRNYRERFERGNMESIRLMIVGLGSMSRGELAGQRMEVALNSKDQEDEHSCFSDNTHRDIVNNALGIENVWLGRYARPNGSTLQGPSLRDLVAGKNQAAADKMTKQLADSVTAAKEIQAPFDREILGDNNAPGRKRVQKTIDSLVQQSKDLAEAATALGITRLNVGKS